MYISGPSGSAINDSVEYSHSHTHNREREKNKMAQRKKHIRRNRKQGLILLIVLGMLAMFTLLAVTYVVTAGSSRQGSLALAVTAICGQRLSGESRRLDGTSESGVATRAGTARDRREPTAWHPGRVAAHRPRPLQGDQRHARTQLR